MSQVPETQEIRVELFPEKDQETVSLIAGPFNDFTIQMTEAVNQSLTIDENMRGATKTLTFNTNNITKTFKYSGKGTPRHLFISNIDNEPSAVIMPHWTQDGKGNITVKIIGTLDANVDYNITFIILAG